jgi:hypothetical protein
MLVNPIQQSSLAYEPARQVLTPPAPIHPLPQTQPATAPIQQGDTPQDKFKPRDGGGGNQQDGGTSDSQKAANAQQLHNAWVRLQQLQQEANEALLAGDARGAKDAAEQAAQVAVQIQNITGSTPEVALGSIEVAAQQISAHDATQTQSGQGQSDRTQAGQSQTGSGQGGSSSIPSGSPFDQGTSGGGSAGSESGSVIDIARAGLGTANEIVDTAASIPSQPAGDLASIQGYKQTVLNAIAGVEAIAARLLGQPAVSPAVPNRVDIQA